MCCFQVSKKIYSFCPRIINTCFANSYLIINSDAVLLIDYSLLLLTMIFYAIFSFAKLVSIFQASFLSAINTTTFSTTMTKIKSLLIYALADYIIY